MQAEKSQTVLLIEDETVVREVTAEILRRAGYEVLTADTGPAGVEEFRRHAGRISAVVIDFSLPQLEGTEVLRRIRRNAPEVPAILCSGLGHAAIEKALAEFHKTSFLAKPFGVDELEAKLAELLQPVDPIEGKE